VPLEFKDKNYWALILGGSAGLGLASAKKLAKHGMNICIIHRDRKLDLPIIEQSFSEIKANNVDFLSFNLDALKTETREEVISKIKESRNQKGTVRVLIHSIAKGNLKPMIGENAAVLSNDDFHLTLESMAFSLYDWTKDLHNCGLFSSDARVISFTSEGNRKAWKNYAAVSAAKAALEAITRNIALEFAPYGIRANCIQAGITDTNSFRMIPGSRELAEYSNIRNPYKRLTLPENIADAVYLLALDEASWINGSVIPVDGGEHLS
jgi:enoyl-[acyl-carrier protein] reductase I